MDPWSPLLWGWWDCGDSPRGSWGPRGRRGRPSTTPACSRMWRMSMPAEVLIWNRVP